MSEGLLKYISVLGPKNKQREYVDCSTTRSRTQQRLSRKNTNKNNSVSPSPSTKRKRKLAELDHIPNPKGNKRSSSMSAPAEAPTMDIKSKPSDIGPTKQPISKLSPELQELKKEMSADTASIIASLQESINILLEIKNAWEQGIQECREVKIENKKLQTRLERVESENKTLSLKVQKLEDKLLEGNIIMQGVPDSLWENSETTKGKVLSAISHTISGESQEDKLNQAKKIPINDVSRLGRYSAMRNRSVLIEFYHKSDAEFLLSNRTHLPSGVFVDKQYSEETEKERRKLRPILKAARRSDNFRGKCRMDGATLVIKGRNYMSQDLHQLPSEINGFNATSKMDDKNGILGFFGELNPLSNFHPSQFSINGTTYHSSEQFIQHQKALFFNDKEAENRVLSASTPLECKMVSKDIQNYDHERWKQNAKATCTPGILAKFEQNQELSNILRSTGNNKIVESCKDKDWGTGVPLYQTNALDPNQWHSQGLLGEILEQVHSIMNSTEVDMSTVT